MRDALGRMQRVVVVGEPHAVTEQVLAHWARTSRGLTVDRLDLSHPGGREEAGGVLAKALAADGDVDVVLVTAHARRAGGVGQGGDVGQDGDVGQGGDVAQDGDVGQDEAAESGRDGSVNPWWATPQAAGDLLDANVREPVTLAVAAVQDLRAQGHGALVWLAAEGAGDGLVDAQTAAVEQHLRALGKAVAADGVQVLVVRPDPTGTVSAADLAGAVDEGLRSGADVVGGTPQVRRVVSGLRDLPGQVLRRDRG